MPGDSVAMDEVLAQIETDKVTMDVRAPAAGVVDSILVRRFPHLPHARAFNILCGIAQVAKGDTVKVGQLVATFTEGAAGAAAPKAAATTKAAEAPAAASSGGGAPLTVAVPSMGESMSEGTIAGLLVAPGTAVRADQVIAQIETDKVTIDVHSPVSGTLTSFSVAKGEVVKVGTPVAVITPGPGPAAAAPQQKAAAAAAPPASKPAAAAAAAAPPKAAAAAPAAGGALRERRVPMTRLRKRVAERLKGAQNTYAMLSTFNEVDMTAIMGLRDAYKDAFLERHGVKLGFMSAFITASVSALKAVPAVNGVIDGDDVVYRDYYDISVAVGTPKGLVVPVLRSCDTMSFAQVEQAIGALGKKARDGTLSVDDMAGGTFTISNGGVYGSLLSTPIINPPQSAILGMHAIVQRPVVLNGQIVARPMMNIALTYDHRLIDGREAVTFLRRIKDVVEDPRRLLLDV